MQLLHASKFSRLRTLLRGSAFSALVITPLTAQISPPEGTLGDKAVFTELGGGEQLTRATVAGATGPVLTQDFDNTTLVAGSHELDAGQIKLSSGRHLVLYDTRFDATAGANRAEVQTALNLAGTRLVAGRSQGYIRRTAGADEAVLSGGAIVSVATSGDVLTLESWRTDTNANAAVLPTRIGGGTAVQLMRLDDDWDFLNLELGANQVGAIGTAEATVAYDTNASPGTTGTAFSVAGGDVTLNESGLYLVFANTSLQKATNATRTNYLQWLALDGSPVAGSTTTTYVRGSEDGNEGMTSLGMVLSATAGQVLNVKVVMDVAGSSTGVIQGGETALTMVKLPATAEYISLIDTSNQEVNDAALDPVVFNTQVGASSASFSHTEGGSAVTVNEDADYLFFGSIFTQSDATNDNQDRTVPLQGWQIDGVGGRIDRGRGAQYNRDNGGARAAGSWGAAIIPLTAAQTVQLTTARIAHTDVGLQTSVAGLQALSCKSLIPSVDPIVVTNSQLSLVVNTTGTIDGSLLSAVDADDGPEAIFYTLSSEPTLGILKNGVTVLGNGDTFTQQDLNDDAITFEAGAGTGSGGFDFVVFDDSGSLVISEGSFVVGVGVPTLLADDAASTDEDTVISEVAPGVLDNDAGTSLAVTSFEALSQQGAVVNVGSDGAYTYDPTAALALQALDDGDSVVDTFNYTVTDYSFATTSAKVDVTVNGVNDAPLVVDDSASGTDVSGPSLNVLANDSDIDANDTITVVSLDGNPVGLGGLTILSGEEATISIDPEGNFVYDPSTSADIGALPNGSSMIDTIAYEVFDGTVTIAGTISITSTGSIGASNDIGIVAANGTSSIDVLFNDDLLGAAGTPTAGAVTDFNASDVGNTDTTWINNGTGVGGLDITMENPGVQSVLNTGLSGAPVGVTAAYDLSGTSSGSVIAATDVIPNIYGVNISATSVTVEMVFRPDDLVGPEPLWGSGGNGTGSSLVLLDDQLIFTAGQGSIVAQAVGTLSNADFVHVLASLDLGTDTASLYIDGVLAGSGTAINITTGAAADITDWSGTDSEGVGRSNGTTGGDINIAPFLGAFGTVDIPDFAEAVDRFDGELAVLRVYSGPVLDATARADNYAAVFGTPSVPAVGDIVDLAGETTLVPGTTVVNLPSGATVKLEIDGTLTYDPNGAFDDLSAGLETTDTFTYTLGGGSPATATVTARVIGTNPDPQVSITPDQTNVIEGSLAGFTITAASAVASDVTVNLSYSGTTQDGFDFAGQATRVIGSGNSSIDLDLTTIADALFEGVSETIIVSIDSVTGPATLSAATVAGTFLDDGDSAPEYTFSSGGGVTEGNAASFTVTASLASSADSTVDVAYTGTADATDFVPISQVTIPAGATSASLDLFVIDDGVADSGETIVATISNPSSGSIGASDQGTATITDGAGIVVFFADFEGVNPIDTPGGTLLNTDAPSAAALGTAIGFWDNLLIAASGGAAPGLILEGDDVRGDGIDTMLRQDRPGTPAEGEVAAVFNGSLDISGSNSGTISFDVAQLRTLTADKNTHIVGLDPLGNKSFEFVIHGGNAGPGGRALYHVDSLGALTQISEFNTVPNSQDFGSAGNNESGQVNIRIVLTSTGYTIALDERPMDGIPDLVTGELAYAGTASLVSRLVFQISGSTDININGGLLIDNVIASGISTGGGGQEEWRQFYYGSAANSGPGADDAIAANGLTNLMNFALGLDPTISGGQLAVDAGAGTILSLGPPSVWVDPADGEIYLRYTRRTDLGSLGYSIFAEFNNNLSDPFEASVDAPVVIANGTNDGVAIEAVQVVFPQVLPINGGPGRFGRVRVTEAP